MKTNNEDEMLIYAPQGSVVGYVIEKEKFESAMEFLGVQFWEFQTEDGRTVLSLHINGRGCNISYRNTVMKPDIGNNESPTK